MKKLTVVTHNGVFHADEIFAIAAIAMAHKGVEIEVIRTRDPKEFENGDFVIDVGGKYDGVKFFDHHQRDFNLIRENGVKYSSFGLIWKLLGEKICTSKEVTKLVDERLVKIIDAVDNGQAEKVENSFTINDVISGFNQNWYEDGDEENRLIGFKAALNVAERVLDNVIRSAKGFVMADEEMKKTKLILDGKVLLLERFVPWQQYVRNTFPDSVFVIFPDSNGTWRVQAIPEDKRSFKSKKSLPESWAGLNAEELQKVTGINDAIFCHAGRFIAGAKSKEGILKMAELALSS